MEWTCTECGVSESAEAVGLLVKRGWWITERAGRLCPSCVREDALSRHAETLKLARSMSATAGETRRLATDLLATARAQRRALAH
jgi:hypothetical protein